MSNIISHGYDIKETFVGIHYNAYEPKQLFESIKGDPLDYINATPKWKRLMSG